MKTNLPLISSLVIGLLLTLPVEAQQADRLTLPTTTESYPIPPDSMVKEGVPKGEVLRFSFNSSKIFPGTIRDYAIYIPAQYNPNTPACVYVNQDGPQPGQAGQNWTPNYRANIVFDNLIHGKEMPVTIAIFIGHGRVPAANQDAALDRMNRSFEYDGLGDSYVRFLLEELLPDVETKKASDGRAIRLSKNGNDRAIGGSSSGAIAAFTAAWERPDQFSRVFSGIGTYVGLRGGHEYSTLIRKYEPKPIRIFLQSGEYDNNLYGGDWWIANQAMERSFLFSGYEVDHVWGTGGHNSLHATYLFPQGMRFLWKNWPTPVKNGKTKNEFLNQILIPGEDWKLVGEGYGQAQGTAANAKGEVFFNDVTARKTYKIGLDGKISVFLENSRGAIGQEFGPDGKLYAVVGEQIVAYTPDGLGGIVTEGIRGQDLTVSNTGHIYVTNPPTADRNDPSKLYWIKPNGEKTLVDEAIVFGGGATLSPDKTQLYVPDHRSHWMYAFQVQPDGSLAHKQKLGHFHIPDYVDKSGAYGLRVDRDGRIYVSSYMGLQVFDQLGRVQCILPTPNIAVAGRVWNLCFGGANLDTIFVASGDKIYSRKLKVQGSAAWTAPNKPGQMRL